MGRGWLVFEARGGGPLGVLALGEKGITGAAGAHDGEDISRLDLVWSGVGKTRQVTEEQRLQRSAVGLRCRTSPLMPLRMRLAVGPPAPFLFLSFFGSSTLYSMFSKRSVTLYV